MKPGFKDALRIYGNLSLLEMASALLAARTVYASETVIEHGGVMSLWGKASDLPSLDAAGQSDVAAHSETQVLRSSFANPDLHIIFTLAECPYRIICHRSAGIARLADLREKKWGQCPSRRARTFLDQMLRTVGLTEQDVTTVPFMAKTQAPLSLMHQAYFIIIRQQLAMAVNACKLDAKSRRRKQLIPRRSPW
jgi:hypothetical protein